MEANDTPSQHNTKVPGTKIHFVLCALTNISQKIVKSQYKTLSGSPSLEAVLILLAWISAATLHVVALSRLSRTPKRDQSWLVMEAKEVGSRSTNRSHNFELYLSNQLPVFGSVPLSPRSSRGYLF